MNKVGIVGSRWFTNYDVFLTELKSLNLKVDVIISGGAKGVDSLAEQYAKENNIPIIIYYPDWNKHGKSAGFIRNKRIVENSDSIIAFWDNKSLGTKNTIDLAMKCSKKVIIVEI